MSKKTFLLGALILMGCQKEMIKEVTVPVENQRFIYQSPRHGVVLNGLRSQTRNGLLHVQAEVQNKLNQNANVFWRVRWLNDGGFQIGDGEVWKPVNVGPGQLKLLESVATSPQAVDFKYEIKVTPE
ncbi:YcfL family protein [Methylophilus glucosoxydans]|uniref:YcfL family protein n=1 Tax=Methylophilus glucosoxydans TaxID=752553 RepID=A0ABW3GHC4_9PROT